MAQITSSTPISAAPFNQYWVQSLNINGSPAGKTTATVMLKPFNGTLTLDSFKVLNIPDVFGLAATDPTFAAVVTSLINEIERQAKLKGVIS